MPGKRAPSPEEAALLDAVRAAPDDDAPRLRYADWLAERGDARAELIRVQCELARPDVPAARRAQLLLRERELFGARRDEWLQPLRALHVEGDQVTWRRGFVEEVTLFDFRTFARKAAALFTAAPGLTGLTFHGCRGPQ